MQEQAVQEQAVQEQAVQESGRKEPNSNEEIISLIDELSRDFDPEQVLELVKIHCRKSKIQMNEKEILVYIDKKNDTIFKKNNKNLMSTKETQIAADRKT